MPHPRRALRALAVVACLVVTLTSGLAVAARSPAHAEKQPVTTHDVTIPVTDGPEHDHHVEIDATVYGPNRTPAPAVIVSPGFGGSKKTVAAQAEDLANRGFVALAYTPRGFGHSTGKIALNSPDYEVSDARQLVDWLAHRKNVTMDGRNDPRVGVTGGSYGGALSLLLAGYDKRVDAIAPVITYNDLTSALLPNAATTGTLPDTPAPMVDGQNGVFKREWAGNLFAAGFRGGRTGAGGGGHAGNSPSSCGGFMPKVCRAYRQLATTGDADAATLRLLHRNSPVSVTNRIRTPTFLVQGERDTLFGLGQADANARQIHGAGGTVKVAWYAGGHDGGPPGDRIESEIGDWFSYYLTGEGDDPGTGFSYAVPSALRSERDSARTVHATAYPGLAGGHTQRHSLPLSGEPQVVHNPAGGSPAALSSVPGAGLGRLSGRLTKDIPGEVATFDTAPLRRQRLVAGSSQVRLRVQRLGQGGGPATLFVKLYDVGPNGSKSLPGATVAPVRIAGGSGEVTVSLAGIVAPVEQGHRLEVAVSTTDRAYENAQDPAIYRISIDGGVSVPLVPGSSSANTPFPLGQLVAIGVLLLLLLLVGLFFGLRSRRGGVADAALADVPLVLENLSKTYRGKLRVVDSLSFRVEHGQVLGLLGPNGAGKTTALRMLLGLVRPTTGEVMIFGHRIRQGSAVLSRVGTFVERPGFLPHLSGMANLRLYWRSTGRPTSEAHLDEALEIADLGNAVYRKVGTYSLGMRQRLAVAQAMLGLPELLVLDEPTNGLDPPQIRDTREMLRRYAAEGRTVLVSSHVLAEVEQTCSHVVVMNHGRLVASGAVDDMIASNGESVFTVDDPAGAATALSEMDGVTEVRAEDATVSASLGSTPRSIAVGALVEAGIAVEQAGPRGRLEDTFLRLVEEGNHDQP